MRERALTGDEQVLANATRAAIEVAGGLEVAARETGKSISQLSRCQSPHNPDSLTIRDATIIEAIGHGRTGHPHIVRALARLLGGVFVPLPVGPEDPDGIRGSVVTLTCELGDVARAIGDALSDDGEVDAREATDALLQLDELDAASAALRIKLQRIAATPKKGRAR